MIFFFLRLQGIRIPFKRKKQFSGPGGPMRINLNKEKLKSVDMRKVNLLEDNVHHILRTKK
jgi:hypothetical protein